jgi:hypothetical protein
VLEAVDREQQAGRGEHDAGRVHATGAGRAHLAEQDRCEDEEHGDDGKVDQEDRAPPQPLQQDAAEDRADGEPRRECGGEDADGLRPSARVGEQLAQHGQRRGQERRAGHPHQRTRCDEELRARRERRSRRAEAEDGRADHQQLQPAVPVADVAERDQQGADGETVDVEDPQGLVGRGGEGLADPGHRQEQDRAVHGHQQYGPEDHREPEPGPQAGGVVSHAGDGPAGCGRQPSPCCG